MVRNLGGEPASARERSPQRARLGGAWHVGDVSRQLLVLLVWTESACAGRKAPLPPGGADDAARPGFGDDLHAEVERLTSERDAQIEAERHASGQAELPKLASDLQAARAEIELVRGCLDPATIDELDMVTTAAQNAVDRGEWETAPDLRELLDAYMVALADVVLDCPSAGLRMELHRR